jgi:hypothetical protein
MNEKHQYPEHAESNAELRMLDGEIPSHSSMAHTTKQIYSKVSQFKQCA